ncbi:MAG: DUF488 domain-containing protein [Chthoniobacteraceae bacterium]
MIQTKSIHEPIEKEADGLRILASRLRGHRVPKSACDVWMANLGPSQELLDGFRAGTIGWEEFSRRYKEELFEDSGVDERSRTIKNHGQKFTLWLLQELGRRGNVTLLCHCPKDEPHCHRHVLKKVLDGRI